VQFYAVKPAFSGVSPLGKTVHGSVMVGILTKADGDVSGVRMLYEIAHLSVLPKDAREDNEGKESASVHIHHERFV
jgi:hypothetical protein